MNAIRNKKLIRKKTNKWRKMNFFLQDSILILLVFCFPHNLKQKWCFYLVELWEDSEVKFTFCVLCLLSFWKLLLCYNMLELFYWFFFIKEKNNLICLHFIFTLMGFLANSELVLNTAWGFVPFAVNIYFPFVGNEKFLTK